VAGCGGSSFTMAPVTGSVKFKDGSIPAGEHASITFVPDGIPPVGNETPPTSSGTIKPDGTFELSASQNVPGAVVGKHKVRVNVTTGYPNVKPAVAAKYLDEKKSDLTAEVKPGPNSFDFQVEKP